MPEAISRSRMEELLAPFLDAPFLGAEESAPQEKHIPAAIPSDLISQLSVYLDLLLRWNARTNLTAVRNPDDMVQRHFGESLFAGRILSPRLSPGATLLDIGSGAGFPGLPIQLLRPDLRVMLAESQGKKASFLREAIRTLGLSTEIFAARAETMPEGRRFDAVTLRAVDNMGLAVSLAIARTARNGWLAALGDGSALQALNPAVYTLPGRDRSFLEVVRL